MCFFFGNMGKTVKHLCCNYGFNRYNVLAKRTISDIFKLKLSDEQQRTVDQVHELLTARHIPGFDHNEFESILQDICTS